MTAPEPDVDDYWAPEPVENEAVAEWWAHQPESGTRAGVTSQ